MTSHLLFDPDCGFCTTMADRMRGWPLSTTIEPLSPGWLADPRIDPVRAQREIPFIDGDHTSYGAEAFGRALSTGPLPLRLVGSAISQAPVLWLARPVYRIVASHRHELPGSTDACRLPER